MKRFYINDNLLLKHINEEYDSISPRNQKLYIAKLYEQIVSFDSYLPDTICGLWLYHTKDEYNSKKLLNDIMIMFSTVLDNTWTDYKFQRITYVTENILNVSLVIGDSDFVDIILSNIENMKCSGHFFDTILDKNVDYITSVIASGLRFSQFLEETIIYYPRWGAAYKKKIQQQSNYNN